MQTVIETAKPAAEVARDLRVNDGTLSIGVAAWRGANPEPATALSPIERARLRRMKDEIRRLRIENDFLKGGGLLRADAAVAER